MKIATMKHPDELMPPRRHIFRPLIETSIEAVKVVIVGPEPYALRPDIAQDGFAYSAARLIKDWDNPDINMQSLSLLTELINDQHINIPKHCHLIRWVKQGVMLWNWRPTTEKGILRAHEKWGWGALSQEILETLWLRNPDTVFVPWGLPNDVDIHRILPTGAIIVEGVGPGGQNHGFLGSSPFTAINRKLVDIAQQKPIDWNVSF